MSDIMERLTTDLCPENHGCGSAPKCLCATMEDAADELASLRARLAEVEEERDRLRAALDVSNHYFRQMHQLVKGADPADEITRLRALVQSAYHEGEENGIHLAAKQPGALRGWENSKARAALDAAARKETDHDE